MKVVSLVRSLALASGLASVPFGAASVGYPSAVRILEQDLALALPTSITWTKQPNPSDAPNFNGYTSGHFNPVSNKTLWYLVPNTTGNIWSMAMFEYEAAANEWRRKGGTASPVGVCDTGASSDVLPWPGNRHPYQQMAIDTKRARLWLSSGVCNGVLRDDLWYYDLAAYTWTRVAIAAPPSVGTGGNMIHDPDTDALVLFGSGAGFLPRTYLYCIGASLTATHAAAGCTATNTWTLVTTTGGTPRYHDGFPNAMYYDRTLHKAILFSKEQSGGRREVWDYTVATKAWRPRQLRILPAGENNSDQSGELDVSAISSGPWAGKYLLHVSSHHHGGSCTGKENTADYLIDLTLNLVTPLLTVGAGNRCVGFHVWDAFAQRVVVQAYDGSGRPEMWIGALK